MTVGKLDTQPEKVLTTETFRKIEVEMELGRNHISKLKRILGQVVTVETGVREALRSWDRMGADQLELSRIGNFELKIPATKGKKGEKGTPANVEVITRDVVMVRDVAKMVEFTVEQRSMDKERTVVRISIDSGSGSLKILGSIFHENEDSIDPAGSLLTGINEILHLGYVEDLQESWHNMRILLELI